MDLTSTRVIKNLLRKHNARPSKRFGQNFLISRLVLKKIIRAAELQPSDIVLEIGPGLGNLTKELAQKAKKVIAIEKDQKMIEILKETLKDFKNVEIIQADILRLDPKAYTLKPYKIVANLPYYLVAPVIRKFLESKNPPKEMILMVQKEVAQRISAKPPPFRQGFGGQAKMNLLAVSVQFYAKAEIISYVSKKSFWPRPGVDAAILKIVFLPNTHDRRFFVKRENRDLFFKVVRAGFSQPRKQLINNLSRGLKISREQTKAWLLKNKIQPSQRAETLKVEDWINLTKSYGIISQ